MCVSTAYVWVDVHACIPLSLTKALFECVVYYVIYCSDLAQCVVHHVSLTGNMNPSTFALMGMTFFQVATVAYCLLCF